MQENCKIARQSFVIGVFYSTLEEDYFIVCLILIRILSRLASTWDFRNFFLLDILIGAFDFCNVFLISLFTFLLNHIGICEEGRVAEVVST